MEVVIEYSFASNQKACWKLAESPPLELLLYFIENLSIQHGTQSNIIYTAFPAALASSYRPNPKLLMLSFSVTAASLAISICPGVEGEIIR